MARLRTLPTSASAPPVTGKDYMDAVQARVKDLWDLSTVPLTTIGGTANALTAVADPVLTAGITAGMKFTFVAASTNTGTMTIAINGGTPIALVTDAGAAMGASQIAAGTMYFGMADGTSIRVLGTANILKVNDYQAFTANGIWNKPAGTPANALVTIKVWSGGGGGGAGTGGAVSGGGGGGCMQFTCRASDLASSVSITIGAGGAIANAGGTSSFGTLVVEFGGGAGANASASFQGAVGGGGGGGLKAGSNGTSSGSSGTALAAADPGDNNAGTGCALANINLATPTLPLASNGTFGGGAGGSQATSGGQAGGKSMYGGGGGSSRLGSSGGASAFAGNGGAAGIAGAAPAGGGGSNAAGARGEVRVFVNG